MIILIGDSHLEPNLNLLEQLGSDFITVLEFAYIIININHLQSFVNCLEFLIVWVQSLVQNIAVLVIFDVLQDSFNPGLGFT